MRQALSKSGIVCLIIAAFLAGCGVKPKLKDLEVPNKGGEKVVLQQPAEAETIDGKADGPVPLSRSKEKRSFILDFLL